MSTPSPDASRTSTTSTVRPLGMLHEGAAQRVLARLLGRPLFWVIFMVVAFGWPIVRVVRTAQPPLLPVLGVVADFQLVDQNARRYGSADLKGRVWLASAIETTSPAAADKLATELGKIQHRARNLGPAFHIVTLGMDAEVDSPARLLEFTTHHRVSPRMWSFLSGDPDGLRRAQEVLGLRMRGATETAGAPQAAPSNTSTAPVEAASPFTVLLVDGKMQVRGRYDLTDPSAIDVLLYHTGLLVNRGG